MVLLFVIQVDPILAANDLYNQIYVSLTEKQVERLIN